MARVSTSILLAFALALAAATFTWHIASPSAAATPKPTTTATPAPTATPLPPGYVHVRVVDDVNANGREDPGERGLGGANIEGGCSDGKTLATTDSNGDAIALLIPSDVAGGHECFQIQRRVGWLPVTSLTQQIPTAGVTGPVRFFIHVFGSTVMELHGETFVRGLPAEDVTFSRTAPPFTGGTVGCIEAFREGIGWTLIVVGSDLRAGCPSKGDRFSVIMEDQIVGTFPFLPGTIAPDELTFVAGGDSMLVVAGGADGAQIDGADCAVVRHVGGGLTPPGNFIYVLSDEARAGCGTPGKLIRFTKNGRPLDPLVPWHAGAQNGGIEFTDAKPRVITPPSTGSAGLLPGARAD